MACVKWNISFHIFFSGTLYLLCFLLRYYSPRSSQGFLLIIQISLQTLLIQNDFLSLLVKANLHPLPPPPGASTSFHLFLHLLVSKLFLVLLFKYLLSVVLHAPLNTYNIIYTHLPVFFHCWISIIKEYCWSDNDWWTNAWKKDWKKIYQLFSLMTTSERWDGRWFLSSILCLYDSSGFFVDT